MSRITASTASGAASIVMLELAWSATERRLVLQDEGGTGAPEVPDVHALRLADAHPPDERLVHVTEEHEGRLRRANGLERGGAPALEAPRLDVVQEVGDRGRDVAREDLDRPDGGHLLGVLLVGDLVRGPHRRLEATAHE